MKKIFGLIVSTVIISITLSLVGITLVSQAAGQPTNKAEHKVNVLIGFNQTPGHNEEAMVRGVGGTIKYTYHLVPAIAANLPEAAINGLLNNPRVKSIDIDGMVYAVDTELDNAWGVKRIGSGIVHDDNKGTGVKIGIIDSGVDYTHQDLDGVYVEGYDFVQNDDDPMDVYGHGTHVAGSACAEDNDLGVVGVAPECALYALRVLNDDGVGSWSRVIAAMEWAVSNRLQVVNLSLGSSQDQGSTVKAAFDNAEAAGLLIVAAAGNSGNLPGRGNNVIYPAKFDSVIAVAATDSSDKRASWSSTGDQVELAAPGVAVYSTWNDDTSHYDPQPVYMDGDYYKEGSGTSMASPHVAGTGALVIAAGITDTNGNGRINDEVREVLATTAEDLGKKGRDTLYGFGLVNAVAAVAAVAPPATGSISGKVIDADIQQPINGATVTDGTRSDTTDICGVYTLTDVPEGTYTVTASAIGYQKVSRSVTVTRDSISTANFSLQAVSEPPTECKTKGVKCNCDGVCNQKETHDSCPWDCPQ